MPPLRYIPCVCKVADRNPDRHHRTNPGGWYEHKKGCDNMSTRTVRTPFYGEYTIENGPSIEGLNQVNGLNREKKLPVRDKSVAFHLKRHDTGEKRVIRATITNIALLLPAPSDETCEYIITGFVIASSNYGRLIVQYDTAARTGTMEIMPLAPHVKPRKAH